MSGGCSQYQQLWHMCVATSPESETELNQQLTNFMGIDRADKLAIAISLRAFRTFVSHLRLQFDVIRGVQYRKSSYRPLKVRARNDS